MVLSWEPFFWICSSSKLWHFFLAKCSPNQLRFPVVVLFHMIHFFDEAFLFLATVAIITEKVSFSVSMVIIFRNRNCFNTIIQFINLNYRISGKQIKTIEKFLTKLHHISPLLRTQAQAMRSKCSKNYFFGFLLPFVIYLTRFDLLSMFYFFKCQRRPI